MTSAPEVCSSPLLDLFRTRELRDLYSIASRSNLADGLELCQHAGVTAATWNEDKTSLAISFSIHATTSLTSHGSRILTGCSCRLWRPGLQCPHVVAAWAVIKRLSSPDSLSQLHFNPDLLEKTALLGGIRAADGKAALKATDKPPSGMNTTGLRQPGPVVNRREQREMRQPERLSGSQCQLVISKGYGNHLQAGIYHGREQLQRWSSQWAPAGMQRFLMTSHYFDGSPRYFENFLSCSNGKQPIVFRTEEGQELPLTWRPDLPLGRTVTLAIQNDTVQLIRTLGKGGRISPAALYKNDILVNPETGIIHPLLDQRPWKLYEELEEQLYQADDPSDEEQEFYGDDAEVDGSSAITTLPHGIRVTAELFNRATLELPPETLLSPAAELLFFHNGTAIRPGEPENAGYLLNIAYQDGSAQAVMTPLIKFQNQLSPFSSSTFSFLQNSGRAGFPATLRAKKRVRHLVETAFSLLDEEKSSVRTRLLRTALATPDFIKRDIKQAARQLLNHFLNDANLKPLLLNVSPAGWHFVEDDRMAQAGLVRIILDLFGYEALSESMVPGGAVLPASQLIQQLPVLAKKLEENGFGLLFELQPLATGQWQFSLDATSSSLDWFELKPEIRVNGELLNEKELQELVGGSGILRKNGRMVLLDTLSAQVLAMFSSVMPPKKLRRGRPEPVRVPRLQILDWLNLRKHGVEVKLSPEDAGLLENLLHFERLPAIALPGMLTAELRHYQQDAWHWLAFLYQHRFGACLADDMGLGKTIQGITLLAGIMSGEICSAAPAGSPHLVVAPPSLLFNWEAEINRFLPAAKVLLYTGTGRSTGSFAGYDIIITSYGIIQRDKELLARLRFDVLIFDETQMVKNLQAATANAVRKLRGSFSLALTGTPVENHLGEYYAIMDLCLPGLLGSHEEFNRQINKEGAPAIQRLIQRTRPFILRRTKQMIAAELPPKIEIDIQLELSPKQRLLYQRTVEEVKGQVQEAFTAHAPAQARIIALTAILRLRQICLAPVLAAASASDASPKLDFLIEQLHELQDEGHSCLVFSQFTSYLNLIEKGLRADGIEPLRLDGATPVPHRKKLVQTFQNADRPMVFLISLKAGGKGLNLTRATYVYHMDPWWNPAVENQASDRAHRIGQTEQVTITRLIMRHTIEEKMMELKARKRELYRALLEEGTGSGSSGLSREDFEFLLG